MCGFFLTPAAYNYTAPLLTLSPHTHQLWCGVFFLAAFKLQLQLSSFHLSLKTIKVDKTKITDIDTKLNEISKLAVSTIQVWREVSILFLCIRSHLQET